MLLEPSKNIMNNRIKLIYKKSTIDYAKKSTLYLLEVLLTQKIHGLGDISLHEEIEQQLKKTPPTKTIAKLYHFLGKAFLEQHLGNFSLAKKQINKAFTVFMNINYEKLDLHLKKDVAIFGVIIHKILNHENLQKWIAIRLEYENTTTIIDLLLIVDNNFDSSYQMLCFFRSLESSGISRTSFLAYLMCEAIKNKKRLFENIEFDTSLWDKFVWSKSTTGPYIPNFLLKEKKKGLSITLDYTNNIPNSKYLAPFFEEYFRFFETIDAILNRGIIPSPFIEVNEKKICSFLKGGKKTIYFEIGDTLHQKIKPNFEKKIQETLFLQIKWINKKNNFNIIDKIYYQGQLLQL